MVKPCFIWKHNGAYHVVDIPGNVYGVGSTVQQAVNSAVRNGVCGCEIDLEGVSFL